MGASPAAQAALPQLFQQFSPLFTQMEAAPIQQLQAALLRSNVAQQQRVPLQGFGINQAQSSAQPRSSLMDAQRQAAAARAQSAQRRAGEQEASRIAVERARAEAQQRKVNDVTQLHLGSGNLLGTLLNTPVADRQRVFDSMRGR